MKKSWGLRRALVASPADATRGDATVTLDEVVFHPELMIRWDDEATPRTLPDCARPAAIGTRPVRRSPRR